MSPEWGMWKSWNDSPQRRFDIKLNLVVLIIGAIIGFLISSYFYSLQKSDSDFQARTIIDEIRDCFSFNKSYCDIQARSPDEIQAALEYYEKDPKAQLETGLLKYQLGRKEEGYADLINASNRMVVTPQVYYALAYMAYDLKKYNDTIYYCGKYLAKVPNDLGCIQGIVLSSNFLNDFSTSKAYSSYMIEFTKGQLVQSLDARSFANFNLQNYSEAIQDEQLAVLLSPYECRYLNLGQFYFAMGDLSSAIYSYEKAALLNKNFFKDCWMSYRGPYPFENQTTICFETNPNIIDASPYVIRLNPICYDNTNATFSQITGKIVEGPTNVGAEVYFTIFNESNVKFHLLPQNEQ